MKKIILIAVALLSGGALYAQNSSTSEKSRIKYGIKAGLNLPKYHLKPSGITSTETVTNFHLNGYVELPIANGLVLQPGISLQGKGGKLKEGNLTVKDNLFSIDIPVNVVKYIPVGSGNIFIGVGPYLGFNIAGQRKLSGSEDDSKETLKFGNSESSDLRVVDFGFNGLIGYQLKSGLNFGAGYGLGVTNLATNNSGDGKLKNRILSFSVGYSF